MEHKISIEISARHVHLPEDVYKILFGEDAEMTVVKPLSGGGAFVDARRVTLVGPKREMQRVAVLGPYRPLQIELSKTDARTLGVDAPIRISGNTAGSAPIKIIGDCGEYEAPEGAIVAKRHIHIGQSDADAWGVTKGQNVKVRVESEGRTLTFEDVEIRPNPDDGNGPNMHIDTDEGNAAGMNGPGEGWAIVE